MWRLLIVLLVLMLGKTAGADTHTAATVEHFRAEFADWLHRTGADSGALALRYVGEPVATLQIDQTSGQTHDMASLSKAITAVCIAALVDEGRLSYDTHAREILSQPRSAPVSIAQLLTHTCGLRKDHTQGPMAAWRNDPTPRWVEVAETALHRDRISPDTSYYYSNENYAVLGAVIEAVTGETYASACRNRVLAPAGIMGQGTKLAASFLPWGGWGMTVADYAAFYDYAYGPNGILSDRLTTLPRGEIAPDVSYGMGVLQRDVSNGTNIWHFGALCFHDGPNLGSYAVHWQNGWTVTAWWDACASGDDMVALDQVLARAAYQAP